MLLYFWENLFGSLMPLNLFNTTWPLLRAQLICQASTMHLMNVKHLKRTTQPKVPRMCMHFLWISSYAWYSQWQLHIHFWLSKFSIFFMIHFKCYFFSLKLFLVLSESCLSFLWSSIALLLHFTLPLSAHPLLQGKGGVATAPALERALSLLHKRLSITCLLNWSDLILYSGRIYTEVI